LWFKTPARTLLFVFMVKLLDVDCRGFYRSMVGIVSVPSACDKGSYTFRAKNLLGVVN
jgi:hypothetical protein